MLTVTFYLKSGSEIIVDGIKSIELTRNGSGGYTNYSIKWEDGCQPALFSMNIDQIAAVVAREQK